MDSAEASSWNRTQKCLEKNEKRKPSIQNHVGGAKIHSRMGHCRPGVRVSDRDRKLGLKGEGRQFAAGGGEGMTLEISGFPG
jgi:hypothetical protein